MGFILAKAGCSDEVIAAGILHNALEDTLMTIERIERMFGRGVAALVTACSEPDKSLPWEIRKKRFIDSIKKAPLDVRVIASADKLHNLRTMVRDRDLGPYRGMTYRYRAKILARSPFPRDLM